MTIYLTPEGKEKLKKELKVLIAKRPKIAIRIEKAKEQGDLKENAEYHDAKDSQGMVEARIREIQATLNQGQVIERVTGGDTVTLGSKIKVLANNSTEKEYEIVGVNEASPLEGKISSESPLGKAFLGQKVGNSIEIEVPAGKISYKIEEIK
tara:strand:- start:142 stop:597 length:456 start_codon:yes stop_codon:yes gene_type:complete